MAVITTSDINAIFKHTYVKNKKLARVLHGKKHRALLNGMTKRPRVPSRTWFRSSATGVERRPTPSPMRRVVQHLP